MMAMFVRNPIAIWQAHVLAMIAIMAMQGCLIDEHCYSDADCSAPQICDESGACVFQCSTDEDCEAEFGVAYVCEKNRCRYPQSCLDCNYPHASLLCEHGACSMGSCDEGYWDANSDSQDGCEYACELTNGGNEICDRQDNDCDGQVDEGYELDTDPDHCGACDHACPVYDNVMAVCSQGVCTYSCRSGYYDANSEASDGCEETTCIARPEICDGRDNDCDCPGDTNSDGIECGPGDENVDEGFQHDLVSSCGPYCIQCEFEHAQAACSAGVCVIATCVEGFFDANGRKQDGCECVKTNDGIERCDGVDNDCDGLIDEGEVCDIVCPLDMVAVNNEFCIDKYEASRIDASEHSAGSDNSIATSRPGVLSWNVRPMTYDQLLTFQKACEEADKRLCTKEQWLAACTGPGGNNTYVFGNQWDPYKCNCVDSFCLDHCEANNITPCDTAMNCGGRYGCYKPVPTGSFPDCTNGYGSFDMSGNTWEVVPSDEDPLNRGYEIHGGAFNCYSAYKRLQCGYNATWDDLYAGFRCCLVP